MSMSVLRGRGEAGPLFARSRGSGHNLFILRWWVIVGDAGLFTAALWVACHLLIGRWRGSTGQSGEDRD